MKNVCLLLGCVSVLFGIGLLMVFNTSAAEIIDRNLAVSTHYPLVKQCICGCIGIICALMAYRVGYEKMLAYSPYLFYGLTVCLGGVFIPGIGKSLNGAHRWIFLGPLSLQPSEFMKMIAPLYFIHLYLKEATLTAKRFYALAVRFIPPLVLILVEPDNGTVAIIMLTLIALFFICRIRWQYWLLPTMLAVGLAGISALHLPYVKTRMRAYLYPEEDLLGRGHQPYQAKIAAGSGGLFGRGLGESMQKLNYLPEARSDYIAAIYAEEFGFMGIVFLVLLYLSMVYSGLSIALRATTQAGVYIASITTVLIAIQAFLNLGVVSGLLPSKGTNLPFFSQGGTSLIANGVSIALLISVFPTKDRVWKKRITL